MEATLILNLQIDVLVGDFKVDNSTAMLTSNFGNIW